VYDDEEDVRCRYNDATSSMVIAFDEDGLLAPVHASFIGSSHAGR
jgi:hypothetical protein